MKRKSLKKGIILGMAVMLSAVSLCGCGDDAVQNEVQNEDIAIQEEDAVADGGENTEEETETVEEGTEETVEDTEKEATEDASESSQTEEPLETAKIRHYYSGILSGLTCALTLPDMEIEDPSQGGYSMSDNTYAIADVDGDGKEELIISYSTASMAGMMEIVYGYHPDTGELKQEMIGFPGSTYFDNGIIKVEASHNHSRGMDFWPFALSRYQADSDAYAQIGYVDTWSKEVSEIYDSEEEIFPDELDQDGDGILYNISEGAEPSFEYADYKYDKADYDEWYASALGDADEIQLDFKAIDYENFKGYTEEYFSRLKEANADIMPKASTDLAALHFEEQYSTDELEQYLADNYEVEIKADSEEEQIGISEGEEVFRFHQLGEGTISYSKKQVGDITIFGIYPGMEESQALEYLKAYGFYHQGETETSFVTGDGLGNRSVWYEAEDGKIVSISTHDYCAFAG